MHPSQAIRDQNLMMLYGSRGFPPLPEDEGSVPTGSAGEHRTGRGGSICQKSAGGAAQGGLIQSYRPAPGTVLSSGRLELTLALCVTATLVLLLLIRGHIASWNTSVTSSLPAVQPDG